jgi:flagellar protein FliS
MLQNYQKSQVCDTSPEKLIVLLYDGAIAFAQQAQKALQQQDLVLAGTKLLRARNIVSELRNSLDHTQGGELALNLDRLYLYAHDEILRAAREGDPVILDSVLEILTILKEGWQEISQKTDQKGQPEAPPPPPSPAIYTPEPADYPQRDRGGLSITA